MGQTIGTGVRRWRSGVVACVVLLVGGRGMWAQAADAGARVQALSARFWEWRAGEQPYTSDDIPRIGRRAGFVPLWTAAAVRGYLLQDEQFETEWRGLDVSRAPVAVQVDWRLVGSAIARVRWELEVIPEWRRNPGFYVDQGLGAVYAEVLSPEPFTEARRREVELRMRSVGRLLEEGRANLTDMRQPYAVGAMDELEGIEGHMKAFLAGVRAAGGWDSEGLERLDAAGVEAMRALMEYREWLRPQVQGMRVETAVGRAGYEYFLRNVALVGYTPEEMRVIGRGEWDRAVAFEAMQQAADRALPATPTYASQAAQMREAAAQEVAIRRYLVEHGILSVPAGMPHYYSRPVPPYVEALSFLGVTDDLTGPSRLDQDAVSYKRVPTEEKDFFSAITARDTRPLTIHEGVPGHYMQLWEGWQNPDPVRRHYYDSESNEGIGFYAEEMMMIAGLFDGEPKTKEAIYSMMRLRALRVEVDVQLALGAFSLSQAQGYLERTVPMDEATAKGEAAFFASTPGQAITYQIGKWDILRLMADAREKEGAGFSLERFHDAVWRNGNVPFSLQRWEMLGDTSEVPAVAASFAWVGHGVQ